jgi:protease-4
MRPIFNVLLWIIVPLFLGFWLSAQYVEKPAVGLLYLETDIWSGSAEFFKMQLEAAREDPNIKAVVVVINSPGGEVAATQDMYFELLSMRQDMPVVGSINSIAASGGYYLAMATDPIYAKPNSTIGNVGVWGFTPPDIGVNDTVLASGPFKLTASNSEEFLREIEAIKQEFLKTVANSRGDRLEISLIDLSQGFAYAGRQAQAFGMIDELGSQADAIANAAEQAGISNYEIVDLQDVVLEELYGENGIYIRPGFAERLPGAEDAAAQPLTWYLSPWLGAADEISGYRTLPAGLYLLYDVRLGGNQ